VTMKRRRSFDDMDEGVERIRTRTARLLPQEDDDETSVIVPSPQAIDLSESLLSLCGRFGLEPWAAARDDRGLWAFGCALAQWIERSRIEPPAAVDFQLETIRLLTNLLIILGAVVRPPARAAAAPTSKR
jgi:hypothetical protein